VGGGRSHLKLNYMLNSMEEGINTYFGCMVESLPTNASKSRASS